jgi:hypothetical protein
MTDLKKITSKQFLVLSEVLIESSLTQKEFIETKYSKSAINFDETLNFLQELGLLKIIENNIIINNRYKELLKTLADSKKPEPLIKQFLIQNILQTKTSFSEHLNQFLSEFQLVNEQYEFTPTSAQRLRYSDVRNLLMDSNMVLIDSTETKYIISDHHFLIYSTWKEESKISPEEFLKSQEKKHELGKKAELFIIEYEKKRLSQYPHLIECIEHTATIDVKAGYDIKSFDDLYDDKNEPLPRFIEVKAVSPWDFKFYWTKNEVDKAKQLDGNYYLYLLPVLSEKDFDINGLKIIKDPYNNVFLDNDGWLRVDEVVSFSLTHNE